MPLNTMYLGWCPKCQKTTLQVEDMDIEVDGLTRWKRVRIWCLTCQLVVKTTREWSEVKK